MDDFMKTIQKVPKVQIRMKKMLDIYNRLLYNYQSKLGYDTLIQNIILKELIIIRGATITGLDIELKMKISRMIYLESENSYNCKYTPV